MLSISLKTLRIWRGSSERSGPKQLQTVHLFVSGQTSKICKGSNNDFLHCISFTVLYGKSIPSAGREHAAGFPPKKRMLARWGNEITRSETSLIRPLGKMFPDFKTLAEVALLFIMSCVWQQTAIISHPFEANTPQKRKSYNYHIVIQWPVTLGKQIIHLLRVSI